MFYLHSVYIYTRTLSVRERYNSRPIERVKCHVNENISNEMWNDDRSDLIYTIYI
jgi:hypothetical protein